MIRIFIIGLLLMALVFSFIDLVEARHNVRVLRRQIKTMQEQPGCEQTAVDQCLGYWFTGSVTDKAEQRRRICGGK